MNLQREDEAVSSTVATVLLFGGVVTIIGMMMAMKVDTTCSVVIPNVGNCRP